MFKVIIAGGRDFDNYELLNAQCTWLFSLRSISEIEIVSGMASGADALGVKYAKEHGLPVKEFHAKWEKYMSQAGYARNEEMAEYADALIAFWDGKSNGTKDMIQRMKSKNKPVRVIKYENPSRNGK